MKLKHWILTKQIRPKKLKKDRKIKNLEFFNFFYLGSGFGSGSESGSKQKLFGSATLTVGQDWDWLSVCCCLTDEKLN